MIAQDWITPTERRMEILKVLCKRRSDTMANLAEEFGVTSRTIKNDIDYLSLSYPIETVRGRYGGGVKIMGTFDLDRKYLSPIQKKLLEKLKKDLTGKDLYIMNGILKDFALNR
ncbi:HTH domain-containing protein [Clostridium polynesiense]|uniref:HTH domain-containing protein n=1 Tax=Clostridium polynesiense TaxID=1325933 RepID=UPI000B30FA0E|nr:HTH domain-containing protein [Clostridium polynesiense]